MCLCNFFVELLSGLFIEFIHPDNNRALSELDFFD